MLKQAWRSYLASLHPRNIKKIKKQQSSSYFLMFYWVVVSPVYIMNTGEDDFVQAGIKMGYLITKMLPFLLLAWSNIVDKLSVPKAMYFTPMKTEEREEYVKCLLAIKIAMPAMFSFVIEMVASIFFDISILQIVLIVFLYITIGIATYVCSDLVNKHKRHITMAVRDKNGEPKDAWLNIFAFIISILILIGLEIVDFANGASFKVNSIVEGVILYGLLIELLIADIVILKTRYTASIKDRCNYEIAFKILPEKK